MIYQKDIVERAAMRANTTRTLAGDVLRAAVEIINESLCRNEPVRIVGLGVFSVRIWAARRQPIWGKRRRYKMKTIPARPIPHFRPFDSVRHRVQEALDG